MASNNEAYLCLTDIDLYATDWGLFICGNIFQNNRLTMNKQLLPQVCRICLLCIDFLKAILSFLLKICVTTIIYAIVQKAEYEKQKLLDGSDEQIPFDPILHHSNMCKLATVLS